MISQEFQLQSTSVRNKNIRYYSTINFFEILPSFVFKFRMKIPLSKSDKSSSVEFTKTKFISSFPFISEKVATTSSLRWDVIVTL